MTDRLYASVFTTLSVDVAGMRASLSMKQYAHNCVECESLGNGSWTAVSSHGYCLKVNISVRPYLPGSSNFLARDPTKHSTLKDEIEEQSTALYASARLWDDGIVKPTDTRDTVGLALALAARKKGIVGGYERSTTTWDGDGKGFGVFRM